MTASHRFSSLLSSLLLAASLVGCAADNVQEDNYPGTIKQESSTDFSNAPACDLETPCSNGLSCMYVAALNLDTAICVDGTTVCDALECGDGECVVLESYPEQLMCSGPAPDGGDDSDCTVSSDGSSECPAPGGEPGGGGGSEPGNPGPA